MCKCYHTPSSVYRTWEGNLTTFFGKYENSVRPVWHTKVPECARNLSILCFSVVKVVYYFQTCRQARKTIRLQWLVFHQNINEVTGCSFTLGLWLPAVEDENQILELDLLQEEGAGWPFLSSDSAIFQQWGQNLDLPRSWKEHPDDRLWYDAFDWRSKYQVCCLISGLMMTKEAFKCGDGFAW